ncbi:MAG: family 43 glycosylhydrolase [Nocardioides sp.]
MTRHPRRRWLLAPALLALFAAYAVAPASAGRSTTPQAAARATAPTPLLAQHGFADPAIERYAGGVVGAATGPANAIRATAPGPAGPFEDLPPAFESWPSWAVPDQDVWAPDLVKVGSRWLMYFAVRVSGVGAQGRCIAVAAASTPDATFAPVGDRPLVCPTNARTPRAEDRVRGRARDLPREGVIDPSLFRSRKGRLFLLYRTQGTPSTIRMVRLTGGGTRVPDDQRSRQLVRSRGIVENPVLVQRDGRFVLLTSEGWFGHCRYRTLWQRSRSVWDWADSRAHVLLDRGSTGICGPGGADILQEGRVSRLYLHGWVCGEGSTTPCPADFAKGEGVSTPGERRALYGARLRWTVTARPYLGRFLEP